MKILLIEFRNATLYLNPTHKLWVQFEFKVLSNMTMQHSLTYLDKRCVSGHTHLLSKYVKPFCLVFLDKTLNSKLMFWIEVTHRIPDFKQQDFHFLLHSIILWNLWLILCLSLSILLKRPKMVKSLRGLVIFYMKNSNLSSCFLLFG